MARRAGGLGRDMFDILDDNTSEAKKESVSTLRISAIEPRKNQPRKTFEEESLAQLADSIATHGVLQPIIVKESRVEGMYEIIAGERRWRASKLAGLSEIPVVIFNGDDLKAAQVAIIEYVQRQDLNPLEEALGYRDLIERFELTQEQGAAKLQITGCDITRSAVAKIEVGQRHLYPDEIKLLKEMLGASYEDILDDR